MERKIDTKITENQGVKRKAEEDETFSNSSRGSQNKKWKSTNLRDLGGSFTNSRPTTFANDRLKRLRKKIEHDVVPISTVLNPKILDKPETSRSSGGHQFESNSFSSGKSKLSFVYNPYTTSGNHHLSSSVKTLQEEENVGSSFIKTEPPSPTRSVGTTCDTINVLKPNDPKLRQSVINSLELLDTTHSSLSARASRSAGVSPKKSPSDDEILINSANSRLSQLRNSIYKDEKQKVQHRLNSDNNLNQLSPPPSISSSSKNSVINCHQDYHEKKGKAQIMRPVQIVNNANVLTRHSHTSSRSDNHNVTTCTNISSVSNGKKTEVRSEINVCNEYISNSHNTVTGKHSNWHLTTPSLEKNGNIMHNHLNYRINYSEIIDLLHEKFFGNSESQSRTTASCSQTPDVINSQTECPMDWDDDDVKLPAPSSEVTSGDKEDSKELHFIVDTNVFIHDLDVLKDIVNESKGNIKPIIYLPWMVISELDFIKDDKKSSSVLKNKVQKAVRFINENILGGKNTVKGQTVHEVDEQQYVGKSPDDKILSCCLLVKEKFNAVIFVSNDCLLRNKVLINGIPALSTSELIKPPDKMCSKTKLDSDAKKLQGKIQKALEEMSTCCSYIICECAKEAYGKVWNKMSMLSNPPWSLKICFKIFRKYWRSIFQEKFLKQFMQSLEKLEEAFQTLETHKTQTKFDEFVAAYIGLCFFFKDLEDHKTFVETSIKDVKSITCID